MKQFIVGLVLLLAVGVVAGLLGSTDEAIQMESASEVTESAEETINTEQEEILIEPVTMSDIETQNIVMHTTMGDVTIELFTGQMPITTGNILKLVGEGFYDGIKFHRVIPGFMAQVGDPLTKDDSQMALWGTGGPGYTIDDEFVDGLSNVRGTLSMANAGPNTGGSQMFINVADNVFLDGKHPVFGKVIEGMEVVDAIVAVPTTNDRPNDAITIEAIDLI